MRLWILFFSLLLGGCLATSTPSPAPRSHFPTLSDPPKAEHYIVVTQKETIEQYHALLTIYYVYLGEYIDFIAKQYKLKKMSDPKPCLTVLKQKKIVLTNLPELVGFSDDKVVDALIDHLSVVLEEIRNYNLAVDKHNKKIDEMCSGL